MEENNETGIQEVRESIERRIFRVFNCMLDENIIGEKVYIVLLIIQTIQILSFPLVTVAEYDSSGIESVAIVFEFANYSKYIINNGTLSSFWFVFGTHMVIIMFELLCLLMLCYDRFSRSEGKSNWKSMILHSASTILTLISTILVIPMTGLALSTVICEKDCYENIECWSFPHFGLMLLGLLFIIVLLALCYSSSLLFTDHYIFSPIPWAGETKPSKQLLTLGLLFTSIFSTFREEMGYEISKYGVGILIPIFLIAFYNRFIYSVLYHNKIQISYFCEYSLIISVALCSLSTLQFENTFYVSTLLCSILLGIALAFVATGMYQGRIRHILLRDEKSLRSGQAITEYLIFLIPRLVNLHVEQENRFLFQGILNNHHEFCVLSSCPCQQTSKYIFHPDYHPEMRDTIQLADLERIMNKSKIAGYTPIEHWISKIENQWYKFVEALIEKLIKTQPRSIGLKLLDAYYKRFFMKNYYRSYYSIIKTMENKYSIEDSYMVFRTILMLDKDIKANELLSTASKVDLGALVNFQERKNRFIKNVRACTTSVLKFWKNLLSDQLHVKSIFSLSAQITKLNKGIRLGYMELIRLRPTFIRSYMLFGGFLNMVLSSEAEAHEILEKGDMMKRNDAIASHRERSSYDINSKALLIRLSGAIDRLGIVLSVNEWAFEMVGYSPSELIGYNIIKIMPPFIAANHDKYLLNFIKTGIPKFLGKENLVFAKTKTGYYDPLLITIKTMEGLVNGLEYVAILHKNSDIIRSNYIKLPFNYSRMNPKLSFIIADLKGNILGISKKCAQIFGIPHNYFVRKNALSSDLISLKVLNEKILTADMESQLEMGLLLQLNTGNLANFIDQDFILLGEAEVMEEKMGIIEVYMQLTYRKFSDGNGFRSYVFLLVKKVKDINMRSGRIFDMQDPGGKVDYSRLRGASSGGWEGEAEEQPLPIIASSIAASNLSSDMVAVYTFKRTLVHFKKPRVIKYTEIILFISVLLIIGALITQYFLLSWDLHTYFQLFEVIIARCINFAHSIIDFYILIGAINYNFPNSAYSGDIAEYAKQELFIHVDSLSKNEFDLTKIIHSDMLDDKDDFRHLLIKAKMLNPNYSYNENEQDLDDTIVQIITQILSLKDIYEANRTELLIESFPYNFDLYGTRVFKDSKTHPTFQEVQTFSIFYNGANPHILSILHRMAEEAADLIYSLIEKEINFIFIFALIIPAILLLLIIFFYILFKKTQRGKKEILLVFAEIPLGIVSGVIEKCMKFEKEELEDAKDKSLEEKEQKEGRVKREIERGNKGEGKGLLGANIAAEKAEVFRDFNLEDSGLVNSGEFPEEEAKELMSEEMGENNTGEEISREVDIEMFDSGFIEDEANCLLREDANEQGESLDQIKDKREKERKEKEELSKQEKKKKILQYTWSMDSRTLVVLIIISLVGILKGTSDWYQIDICQIDREMVHHIENQNDLILTLSYAYLYTLFYKQTMVPLAVVNGENPFNRFLEHYGEVVLELEDAVHGKFRSSKVIDYMKSTLLDYFSPQYCQKVASIISLTTPECQNIWLRINSHGLQNTLHNIKQVLKQNYLNTRDFQIRSQKWFEDLRSTRNIEFYLLLKKIILPTFTDLINNSNDEIMNSIDNKKNINLLLLIISIFLVLIMLIFIERFFIYVQQRQIFLFKGILNLIPIEILSKNLSEKDDIMKHGFLLK